MTADPMPPFVSQPAEAHAQVFLSHSSADRPVVDWVAAQIAPCSFGDAWSMGNDTTPGRLIRGEGILGGRRRRTSTASRRTARSRR